MLLIFCQPIVIRPSDLAVIAFDADFVGIYVLADGKCVRDGAIVALLDETIF